MTTKLKWSIVLTLYVVLLSSLSFRMTKAYFQDTATSKNNILTAASTFPATSSGHLVINEVYYQVDSTHGLDSLKDRGNSTSGGEIVISDNGAGSTNNVDVNNSNNCNVSQSNNTTVVNDVSSESSTGDNSSNGNTGGTTTITTASSSSSVVITNGGSSNSSSGCGGGGNSGQNDEWVELYNPTDHDVSLKDWSLSDNSGNSTKINANKTIKSHGFALLAKSASTFGKWTIPSGVTKIELGSQIGDGLDNSGDHLILKNASNGEVDRMSWGTDTSGFAPPAINPVVPLGNSTERIVLGVDTDTVSDWKSQSPAKPGN